MADDQVNPRAFTCPPDFTEVVHVEGLCLEDVEDDDTELFIIQTTDDVDLTKFSGQQMHLNGPTTFRYVDEDGQKAIYQCTVKNTLDKWMQNAHLVLPERRSLKLQEVNKEIKGFAFVEAKAFVPYRHRTMSGHKNTKAYKQLNKRFELCSLGDPAVSVEERSRMTERIAADDSLGEDERVGSVRKKQRHLLQDGNGPAKSKKKHKQNKSYVIDQPIKTEPLSDNENGLCANGDTSVKRKKKHKHDRNHEIDQHIKTEIFSGDESMLCVNGETSVGSSRKSKKSKTRGHVESEFVDPQISDADAHSGNENMSVNTETSVKRKKKHKRDRNHEIDQYIKTEIFSGDESMLCLNGEMSVGSSRKSKKSKSKTRGHVESEFVDPQISDADAHSGNENMLSVNAETSVKRKKKHKRDRNYEVDQHIKTEVFSGDESMLCVNGETSVGSSRKSKKSKTRGGVEFEFVDPQISGNDVHCEKDVPRRKKKKHRDLDRSYEN